MAATFKIIKNAVGHSTSHELVHPLDAQRAVNNALDEAVNQHRGYHINEVRDELEEDALEKTQVKRGFL